MLLEQNSGIRISLVLASMLVLVWASGCFDSPDPVTPGGTDENPSPGLNYALNPSMNAEETVSSAGAGGNTGTTNNIPRYIANEVIVVFHDDTSDGPGTDFFNNKPLRLTASTNLRWGKVYKLEITNGTPVPEMVEHLSSDPLVRFAQPNFTRVFHEQRYVPNDPMWESQADSDDDPRSTVWEQWGPSKLGADIVWNETKGDSDIVVAVIDTGILFDHEDLHDNLWYNTDETDGNGIDDDNNGYIDDWWGWNCWQMNNDPNDDGAYAHHHGTGCAGVVAAVQDNNVGVSGIAPGVKLMAIKIKFANDYSSDYSIMEGLNYAAVNDADIVSMSFGGTDVAPGFQAAIDDCWDDGNGCLLIASAGNANSTGDSWPASYPNVIKVGATVPFSYTNVPVDERRIQQGWAGWWWGSNYGPGLDVWASVKNITRLAVTRPMLTGMA